MKFAQLKQLEERFEKAGEQLDATIAALQQDIERNPKMTAQELKWQLAGMLGSVTSVNTMLDVAAEAIHRLSMTAIEVGKESGIDVYGDPPPKPKNPLEVFGPVIDIKARLEEQALTGPKRSDTVANEEELTEGGEPT